MSTPVDYGPELAALRQAREACRLAYSAIAQTVWYNVTDGVSTETQLWVQRVVRAELAGELEAIARALRSTTSARRAA
jgi:hypothetical protein